MNSILLEELDCDVVGNSDESFEQYCSGFNSVARETMDLVAMAALASVEPGTDEVTIKMLPLAFSIGPCFVRAALDATLTLLK